MGSTITPLIKNIMQYWKNKYTTEVVDHNYYSRLSAYERNKYVQTNQRPGSRPAESESSYTPSYTPTSEPTPSFPSFDFGGSSNNDSGFGGFDGGSGGGGGADSNW